MTVIVADTSPLNYLIQIHCEELLPALYEQIFVPRAVIEELSHLRSPASVHAWLAQPAAWLQIREVRSF